MAPTGALDMQTDTARARELNAFERSVTGWAELADLQAGSLDFVQRAFGADACVFALCPGSFGDNRIERFAARGLAADSLSLYLTRYHGIDPFARWFRTRRDGRVPTVTIDEQIVKRENFWRSRIHAEYFGRFRIDRILGIALECERRAVGFIGVYRSRRAPCFSASDLAAGRYLAPVLGAAVQRITRRETVQVQAEAIEALASQLPFAGVVVLDAKLRPLCWSDGAERIVRESSARADGAPTAWAGFADDAGLRAAHARLTDPLPGGRPPPRQASGEIRVGRRRQRARYELRRLDTGTGSPCFLLGFEPRLRTLSAFERLRAQGLSERELDVVLAASGGITNREIAALLCISVQTVQTHLHAIYRKLGVRNRTELLGRLMAAA
ncbi:MAG: helix-turn-helix transcriptional regulator [Gammaproteobacteria bacterium]|nr:helix-turn-helix transcriptional regulator [Gammaproteobacteria bacterium]